MSLKDDSAPNSLTPTDAKFILFPKIVLALEFSVTGRMQTPIDKLWALVTGNPRELSFSRGVSHRLQLTLQNFPQFLRNVGSRPERALQQRRCTESPRNMNRSLFSEGSWRNSSLKVSLKDWTTPNSRSVSKGDKSMGCPGST